jgi:polyisoprenoid-binding protein YceI
MKKHLTMVLTAAAVIGFFAFTKPATNSYKVNTNESTINWLGKKVTGQHNGTVAVSGGTFVLEGKNIKSGTFTIDMKSIKNTDLTDKAYNDKLIGHLNSPDFFSTEKFPTSTFEITNVKNTDADRFDVTGKLTIKGITNEITFPATIRNTSKSIIAVAKIIVDRTKFDIKYGSKNFFESIGNKAIDNDFELDVKIIANM